MLGGTDASSPMRASYSSMRSMPSAISAWRLPRDCNCGTRCKRVAMCQTRHFLRSHSRSSVLSMNQGPAADDSLVSRHCSAPDLSRRTDHATGCARPACTCDGSTRTRAWGRPRTTSAAPGFHARQVSAEPEIDGPIRREIVIVLPTFSSHFISEPGTSAFEFVVSSLVRSQELSEVARRNSTGVNFLTRARIKSRIALLTGFSFP